MTTESIEESNNISDAQKFLKGFGESFWHALLQNPVNGVSQGFDRISNTVANYTGSEIFRSNILPNVQFSGELEPAKSPYSAEWWGQQIGGGFGMMPTFAMVSAVSRAGLTKLSKTITENITSKNAAEATWTKANPFYSHLALGKGAPLAMADSIISGFIYDFALKPTAEENIKDDNLLSARLKQGIVGGATFGIMSGTSIGARSMARSFGISESLVANPLLSGIALSGVSGAVGGFASAYIDSYMHGRELKEGEVMQSVVGMAAGGLALPAGHKLFNLGVDHVNLVRGKGITISRFSEYQKSYKSETLSQLEQEHSSYRVQLGSDNTASIDRQNKLITVPRDKQNSWFIPRANLEAYAHELGHGKVADKIDTQNLEQYLLWRAQRELQARKNAEQIVAEYYSKNIKDSKDPRDFKDKSIADMSNERIVAQIIEQYKAQFTEDFHRLKDPKTNLIRPQDGNFIEYSKNITQLNLEQLLSAADQRQKYFIERHWENLSPEIKQMDQSKFLDQVKALTFIGRLSDTNYPRDAFNLSKGQLSNFELMVLQDVLLQDKAKLLDNLRDLSLEDLRKALSAWKISNTLPLEQALEFAGKPSIDLLAADLATFEMQKEYREIPEPELFRVKYDEIKQKGEEWILNREHRETARKELVKILHPELGDIEQNLLTLLVSFSRNRELAFDLLRSPDALSYVDTFRSLNPELVIKAQSLTDLGIPINNWYSTFSIHSKAFDESYRLVSIYGPNWKHALGTAPADISTENLRAIARNLLDVGSIDLPLARAEQLIGLKDWLLQNREIRDKEGISFVARHWGNLNKDRINALKPEELIARVRILNNSLLDIPYRSYENNWASSAYKIFNEGYSNLAVRHQAILQKMFALRYENPDQYLRSLKSLERKDLETALEGWSFDHRLPTELAIEVGNLPKEANSRTKAAYSLAWLKLKDTNVQVVDERGFLLNSFVPVFKETLSELLDSGKLVDIVNSGKYGNVPIDTLTALRVLKPEMQEYDQLSYAFLVDQHYGGWKNTKPNLPYIDLKIISRHFEADEVDSFRRINERIKQNLGFPEDDLSSLGLAPQFKNIERVLKLSSLDNEVASNPNWLYAVEKGGNEKDILVIDTLPTYSQKIDYAKIADYPDWASKAISRPDTWNNGQKMRTIAKHWPYLSEQIKSQNKTMESMYDTLTRLNLEEHLDRFVKEPDAMALAAYKVINSGFTDITPNQQRVLRNAFVYHTDAAERIATLRDQFGADAYKDRVDKLTRAWTIDPSFPESLADHLVSLDTSAKPEWQKIAYRIAWHDLLSENGIEIRDKQVAQNVFVERQSEFVRDGKLLPDLEQELFQKVSRILEQSGFTQKLYQEAKNPLELVWIAMPELSKPDQILAAMTLRALEKPMAELVDIVKGLDAKVYESLLDELDSAGKFVDLLRREKYKTEREHENQARVFRAENTYQSQFYDYLTTNYASVMPDNIRRQISSLSISSETRDSKVTVSDGESQLATANTDNFASHPALLAWLKMQKSIEELSTASIEPAMRQELSLASQREFRDKLKELNIEKGQIILTQLLGQAGPYPSNLAERMAKYSPEKRQEAIILLKKLTGSNDLINLTNLWEDAAKQPLELQIKFRTRMDASKEQNLLRDDLSGYEGPIPQALAEFMTKFQGRERAQAVTALLKFVPNLGELDNIWKSGTTKRESLKASVRAEVKAASMNAGEDPRLIDSFSKINKPEYDKETLQQIRDLLELPDVHEARIQNIVSSYEPSLVKKILQDAELRDTLAQARSSRRQSRQNLSEGRLLNFDEVRGGYENWQERAALALTLAFSPKKANASRNGAIDTTTTTTTTNATINSVKSWLNETTRKIYERQMALQGHERVQEADHQMEIQELAHEILHFMPIAPQAKLNGLAQWLKSNRDIIDRSEISFQVDGRDINGNPTREFRTMSGLEAYATVAEKWPTIEDPALLKLPLDKLLAVLSANSYQGILDTNLAKMLGRALVNAGDKKSEFKEVQFRILMSAKTPDPVPTDIIWSGVSKYRGQFQPRFIDSNKLDTNTGVEIPNLVPRVVAGKFSGCCQHINGAAEELAWYTQESPNSSVFMVHRQDKPEEIFVQSATLVDQKGNLLLDSVESNGIPVEFSAETAKIYQDMADYLTGATPQETLAPGKHPYYGKYKRVLVTGAAKYPELKNQAELPTTHKEIGVRTWPRANDDERASLPIGFKAAHADAAGVQYVISENPILKERSGEEKYIPPKINDTYVTGMLGTQARESAEIRKIAENYPEGERVVSDGDLAVVLRNRDDGKIIGYAMIDSQAKIVTDVIVDQAIQKEKGSDQSLARGAGLLIEAVADYIERVGGVWQADLRDNTSLPMLIKKARRDSLPGTSSEVRSKFEFMKIKGEAKEEAGIEQVEFEPVAYNYYAPPPHGQNSDPIRRASDGSAFYRVYFRISPAKRESSFDQNN